MNGRVRRRTQMRVDGYAEAVILDAAGIEIQMLDIGDAAGTIDHAIGDHRLLLAVRREHGAQPVAVLLHAGNLDAGMHVDADARALLPDLLDRIFIECGEESRQNLEDGDLGTGASIDMAQFQRDDAAANEQNAAWLLAVA